MRFENRLFLAFAMQVILEDDGLCFLYPLLRGGISRAAPKKREYNE
jgi:hypothetical protein